ncbi:hypothetical protein [Runella aurantiaca]
MMSQLRKGEVVCIYKLDRVILAPHLHKMIPLSFSRDNQC